MFWDADRPISTREVKSSSSCGDSECLSLFWSVQSSFAVPHSAADFVSHRKHHKMLKGNWLLPPYTKPPSLNTDSSPQSTFPSIQWHIVASSTGMDHLWFWRTLWNPVWISLNIKAIGGKWPNDPNRTGTSPQWNHHMWQQDCGSSPLLVQSRPCVVPFAGSAYAHLGVEQVRRLGVVQV